MKPIARETKHALLTLSQATEQCYLLQVTTYNRDMSAKSIKLSPEAVGVLLEMLGECWCREIEPSLNPKDD